MMARARNKRWQELKKDNIPLERLAQHFEAFNRSEGKSPTLPPNQTRWIGHPYIPCSSGKLTAISVQTYVRGLRAFFSWLHKEGYTQENPLADLQPPKAPQHLVEVLTEEEVRRILACLDTDTATGSRDAATVITLLDTGLRLSELTGLRLEDAHLDQVGVEGRFREIIDCSPYLATDEDLRFRWSRVRTYLREANIYIGLNSIWIRPYIYPLISNLHYEQATQRIYMSATIGDPADLSRRLGVRYIVKIPIPPEYAERTCGRRLIVMNRIEDADIPSRLQAAILAALRTHPKSVWLCSSRADAVKFQAIVSEWLNSNGLIGHPTWILTPLGDEIDRFKQSPQGHLFVAGRFDGMDFTADECRLVVVTTVPKAINVQEEFISAYLRDSGFMKSRLNQRIVQALGRCNRSYDDFAIYVLADRRFAAHFGRESNRAGIPRNIVAEIDMAQDAAEIDQEELVKLVESFLGQEFDQYDNEVRSYLAEVPVESSLSLPPDTSADEVIGWAALFQSQNYEIAANRFETCWDAARAANLIEIGALHGWHWAKALYLQSLLGEPSTRDKSLNVLEDAVRRVGQSSWFNRMRASLNRARQIRTLVQDLAGDDYSAVVLRTFDDLLEKLGTGGTRFEQWCQAITTKLQADSHAQYQEGLEQLGHTLGYYASRPRHGAATDCRWRGVFGNRREVITFETKIEQDSSHQIVASDMGQAHNQLSRAQREYEAQGYIVRGTIVTHLTTIAPEAEASAGSIKVLDKAAIFGLWNRVTSLLSL